jgi:hypothetical protein
VDAVEQPDRRAAGADVRHVAAHPLDGAIHPRLDLAEHSFQITEFHNSLGWWLVAGGRRFGATNGQPSTTS